MQSQTPPSQPVAAAPVAILHYALPKIVAQAVLEQKAAAAAYLFCTELTAGDAVRLVLLGVAAEVPERLAAWRAAGVRAPALLLGAAPDHWPVTETLALPVKLGRLLARMEYYAQLAVGQGAGVIACGIYTLDQAAKKLCAAGAEQNLTDKECALLAVLAGAPDKYWSREELLRAVWGYDAALDTHTLETHIYRVRRKLAALGGAVDISGGAPGYRMQLA